MTGRLTPFLRTAAVFIGVSLAFTWFGVYDTGGSFTLRLFMWLITMCVGGAAAIWAIPATFERYLAEQHVALRVGVAAALIAVPVTISLVAFFLALGGYFSATGLLIQYVYVYAVCLVMVASGVVVAQDIAAEDHGDQQRQQGHHDADQEDRQALVGDGADGLKTGLQADHRHETGEAEIAQQRRGGGRQVAECHVAAAIPAESEAREQRAAAAAQGQRDVAEPDDEEADQEADDQAEAVEDEIGLVAGQDDAADLPRHALDVLGGAVERGDVARSPSRLRAAARCRPA